MFTLDKIGTMIIIIIMSFFMHMTCYYAWYLTDSVLLDVKSFS